ncbi:MAG: N-acetyl sugar amidotransferase [Sulfurimonas sp.]|jgi:N-acetyl sugar amidotransferase|uniref:N-acetyl sugar amidotransferase n=1 Tax=Sulfurimonas sp. TaxID=2022749 RepID=UPI0039E3F162
MIYCKKCLTTDLRPNALFYDQICIACQFSDVEASETFNVKLNILKDKIKKTKQNKKSDYDCIIGVSGGKDSSRQAHWVRDRLGLRPLLVCGAYPPRQMSQVGANNLSNLIKMGFDLIVATPAPQSASHLSLESFIKFGNIAKSTEMSLFSTVPRLAIELGINTIFWGENPALQVGDSAVEGNDPFDGNSLRNLNTLTDGGNSWIHDCLAKKHLQDHYIYPEKLEFDKKHINIFYLGPAWDDWSNDNNALYAALQGLELRPGEESITGDISNASMLDEQFIHINFMLKYYKYGFGLATDFINQRIRAQIISRDEGIKIVEQFDGVCSEEIIKDYCMYVGITSIDFWNIANKWTNKKLFNIQKGKRPIKKFKVGTDYAC